jgi:hypothetical protein
MSNSPHLLNHQTKAAIRGWVAEGQSLAKIAQTMNRWAVYPGRWDAVKVQELLDGPQFADPTDPR